MCRSLERRIATESWIPDKTLSGFDNALHVPSHLAVTRSLRLINLQPAVVTVMASMAGIKSTIDYLQVRGYIFFLSSIAPLSILHTIVLLARPVLPERYQSFRLPLALQAWLIAENVAYIFFYLPFKHYILQLPAIHPETLSREEREKLFVRCWATVSDPERYLSQWFRGAKRIDIKRGNVREWICWAFFNTHEVTHRDEEEVESYLCETERLLGRILPPGKSNAKSIRLTLDTVNCSHRSLFWYFCVAVVDTITYLAMLFNGFHFYRNSTSQFFTLFPFRPLAITSTKKSPGKCLTYWYRPHLSEAKLPILFIHGIGVGLYPYTNFLRDLNRGGVCDGDDTLVGVIAIEIMAVSSRITHHAFDRNTLAKEVQQILQHHGWSKCVLVGHSYGTVICSQLLKSPETSPLVGPVVLVDPICFLLHLPDVAYNFMVRRPQRTKEFILWYFGSKDIGVAHTLSRRFFWTENILWKEELGVDDGQRTATVVLSGNDAIVDAQVVRRYLTASPWNATSQQGKTGKKADVIEEGVRTSLVKEAEGTSVNPGVSGSGLKVIWFERFHHGQTFDSEVARSAVIKVIRASYSTHGHA